MLQQDLTSLSSGSLITKINFKRCANLALILVLLSALVVLVKPSAEQNVRSYAEDWTGELC